MLPVVLTSEIPSGTETLQDVDSSLLDAGQTIDSSVIPTTDRLSAAAGEASSFVNSLDWAHPSWDLFIVMFFVLGAFLYGMSLGRDRIIVILVSIYMALAVVNSAPFFEAGEGLVLGNGSALQLTAFLSIFVVLFFLVSRMGLMRTLATSMSHGSWWQVLSFSVLHIGLMVSIVMSFLPPDMLSRFSPLMQQIFASEMSQFVWIIAPIIAMTIISADER